MGKNISHIWVGVFGPKAPDDYFDGRYVEFPDTAKRLFSIDQGSQAIDFDLTEISWSEELRNVRDFVSGHSYSETYLERVVAQTTAMGVDRINVFIIANEEEFPTPQSISGPDFQLWYLGRFDCDDNA